MSMAIPYDFMKNSGARVQRACGTEFLHALRNLDLLPAPRCTGGEQVRARGHAGQCTVWVGKTGDDSLAPPPGVAGSIDRAIAGGWTRSSERSWESVAT
jgi:hypothetical protein